MAETGSNPVWQVMAAQASGMSPQQYSSYMQAQQQEAMANALLQQGTTPIDTNNRQIGGIGYKISPLEGIAKLADVISGKYQQNNANEGLANALMPQGGGSGSSASAGDPIVASMPPQTQAMFTRLMMPEAAGGNPRAGMELYGTYAAGMKSYGGALGTSAAALAPASALPPGVGGPPPSPPPQGSPIQAQTGASPPNLGIQPPITPVQGGNPLPPVGGTPDPQTAAALAAYRQQNDMQIPPIDAQRASAGLPVGVGSNLPPGAPITQNIPPVPASQLSAPPPPQPPAAMPAPQPGESMGQYQARLAAAKEGAIAQAGVAPAGAKTQAEDTAKNLVDATKTYNVAASNLPRAMQRFSELRGAAQNASYGGGVSDQEPEQGFLNHFLPGPDYARSFAQSAIGNAIEPKTAMANQVMEQAANQGILSELGPQMQGLKGNKYLESIASSASGLNMADPPAVKINAINGLQDQYISNLKSLAAQRRDMGDPNAPSDLNLAQMIAQHADPATTISVINPQGVLGRVSPQHLPDLIQAGGQIR